jgi:hypothetical protein
MSSVQNLRVSTDKSTETATQVPVLLSIRITYSTSSHQKRFSKDPSLDRDCKSPSTLKAESSSSSRTTPKFPKVPKRMKVSNTKFSFIHQRQQRKGSFAIASPFSPLRSQQRTKVSSRLRLLQCPYLLSNEGGAPSRRVVRPHSR